MTGILLCCFVILLCVGSLYLIIWHEPLVAAWWYRLTLRREHGDAYPPEAAEAPEYERARLLDEVGPCVVAGSDLDRAHRPIGWVNMRLAEMVAADEELTGLKYLDLSAYYVLPEPSPEVQR